MTEDLSAVRQASPAKTLELEDPQKYAAGLRLAPVAKPDELHDREGFCTEKGYKILRDHGHPSGGRA